MSCQTRPGFRGGKIALEESRDTKSECSFHTLYHCNQIGNCAQEKIELSRMSQKSRLSFNQKLGMSPFSNKEKVKIKCFKNIPTDGKKLESCCLGMAVATSCHPMATGLCQTQHFSFIFQDMHEETTIT